MNSVNLVGSLGKDVELKQSQGGMEIAKFSLATNDGFGDKKKTNWHNVVAFGKTAEIAAKFLRKGSKCGIQGEIEYSEYEKDGHKVYYTSIKVNKLEFLDSKSDSQGQQNYQQPATPQQSPLSSGFQIDDDLPY